MGKISELVRSRSGLDFARKLDEAKHPLLFLKKRRAGRVEGKSIVIGVPVGAEGKGGVMSVAKIIEISSESPKSFEDAIVEGINRASKTVRNIKSAWVKEQHVIVEDGKVALYRVDLKVTFVLE